MAKILGLPFDNYVKKQIEVRQKKLAKTQKDPEDLVVFNSNTSWVRLSSGVKIEPSRAKILSDKLGISVNLIQGNALSRNLVLWGGISSFTPSDSDAVLDPLKGGVGYGLNNAYGFLSNSAQGLQPPPGIESITCNYKNNGALKQAQVKLKCFTRSQFEALEAVYLRLGYTMVLEWGNVLYFNNNEEFSKVTSYSIPNLLFKSEQDVDPSTLQTQLDSNKIFTGGNYDGMLAKVSNYSWNIQDDLSFSITLDLISVGDIIDSLKANIGGISTPLPSPINVNFSGSVENIVTIQLNRNASKLNAFFYELYDEVYKTALTTGEVSGATKEAIAKANEVVDLINSETWKTNQSKYISAIQRLRRYYSLFNEGNNIFKRGSNNSGFLVFFPEFTALNSNDDKRFNEIAKEFGITRGDLVSMYVDEKDEKEEADKYNSALNAIEKFLTDEKSIPQEDFTKINQESFTKDPLIPVRHCLSNKMDSGEGQFGPSDNDYAQIQGGYWDKGSGIFTRTLTTILFTRTTSQI
jgi:hypothetical protein